MANTFPTDYPDKGSADSTDKVWASDGVTNFNITVDEIGTEVFTDRSTTDLSEGTNEYYTDAKVNTVFATKDTDDLPEGATNKYVSATNVNAVGATMNTDTTLVGNGYFLDEDNMSSDDDTKVPSQQSVKAYVDNQVIKTNVVVGQIVFVDSSQTSITIAHGLGVVPRAINARIDGLSGSNYGDFLGGMAAFDGTTITQKCYDRSGTTDQYRDALFVAGQNGPDYGRWAISSIDSTNITLAYTFNNAPAGTKDYIIEFIG